MRTSFISILLLSFMVLIVSCGKSGENEPTEKPKTEDKETKKTGIKGLDDFVDKMEELSEDYEEGREVEVVDFRTLKEMLPESIGNLKRTNATGEKNSAMGFTVSQTEGDYTSEDGSQRISIKIMDMGSVKGWAGLAAWGWTLGEVDRETETGYERTITYKGHKGYEKYDNEYQNGSMEILVAKRYMVSVDGDNVPMDLIKEGLDEVDLGKLESMKDAGLVTK